MKIYSIPFCPFCYRVKLTLKIKEIPISEVQIEEIDLSFPPEDFKKINPSLFIPTLKLRNGDGFADSMVIVEYLDSLDKKSEKFYGNNSEETAKIKFLIEIVSEEITNLIKNCITAKGSLIIERRALKKIPNAFHTLNSLLEKQGTRFFGGNQFNAIDIHIAPFISYYLVANKFNNNFILPDPQSKAGEYFKNIESHAAVKEVILSNEPFIEFIKSFISPPESIKFIKNSSRNIIENIEDDLVNLNKRIENDSKSNNPTTWKLNHNDKGPYIESIFQFKNYEEALNAIQKICDIQESSDHHANFVLENFSQLKVEVCTHQPKWGITSMDIAFAETLSHSILN